MIRFALTVLCITTALVTRAADTSTAKPPAVLVRTVADGVLRDNPQSLDFNWGEGVLLSGMVEACRLTREPRYLEFVQKFAEHWDHKGVGPLSKIPGSSLEMEGASLPSK